MLKYYFNQILYGTISTFVVVILYTFLFDYIASENTPNLEALVVILFLYCCILSLASLPILLSKNKRITNKNITIVMLWFFLPSLFILSVFTSEIISSVEQNIPLTIRHLDYDILFNLSFLVCLIVNYAIFKKENKNKL